MKVIKPTKQEVFNAIRANGCCWLGGIGCECYSRQLKSCYSDMEKQLTRIEKTEEEIEEDRKIHEKVWKEIFEMDWFDTEQ